ncbi:MAG: hypothetical protein GC159_17145 [Phycisphaera sp.]|nr:hypothetical protein [Phycisphaera sp.]
MNNASIARVLLAIVSPLAAPRDVRRSLERLSARDRARLVRRAADEGLAPSLHAAITACDAAHVLPDPLVARVRQLATHCLAHNLAFGRAIDGILDAFRDRGVDVALLKGSHLITLSPHAARHRPMVDVDLLVPRASVAAATQRLDSIGYQQDAATPAWNDDVFGDDYHHAPVFVDPRTGIPIELHHDLAPRYAPFALDVDAIWRRADTIRRNGRDVRVLAPDDLLLHLSLHAAFNHSLEVGVRPLVDIATVIDACGDDVDWPRLVDTATWCGGGKHVHLMLTLAADLVGAAVPADALAQLRPADFDPRFIDVAADFVLDRPPSVGVLDHLARDRRSLAEPVGDADTPHVGEGLGRRWRAFRRLSARDKLRFAGRGVSRVGDTLGAIASAAARGRLNAALRGIAARRRIAAWTWSR